MGKKKGTPKGCGPVKREHRPIAGEVDVRRRASEGGDMPVIQNKKLLVIPRRNKFKRMKLREGLLRNIKNQQHSDRGSK